MRAVVTEDVGTMAVRSRDAPGAPGPGQVIVHPQATGVCGSDFHFLAGELSAEAGGGRFPRVQGHEVAGAITAVGRGCDSELRVGQLVALYPVHSCGTCYPCRIGRPNTCENFELIGIHVDGGLQERLVLPAEQVFPIRCDSPAVAALAEPISIAVRAMNRARVAAGERVVVLGAGPIGQCVGIVARERGAEVLLVDLVPGRVALAGELGAESLLWESAAQVIAAARQWAAPDGPAVVVDATGAAPAVQAMIEIVASAGRAVQVGMSNAAVTIRLGQLTEKELDVLGVCCCGASEFGQAVAVVERNAGLVGRLISHEFGLEEAPDALRFAMSNPREVMKVVIRGE